MEKKNIKRSHQEPETERWIKVNPTKKFSGSNDPEYLSAIRPVAAMFISPVIFLQGIDRASDALMTIVRYRRIRSSSVRGELTPMDFDLKLT